MAGVLVVFAVTACSGKAVVDPPATTTSTTSGTSSTTSSSSSSGPKSCDELAAAYQTALASARKCDPAINAPQCVAVTGNELACPCPTYVNPDNAAAVTELAALSKSWTDQGCGEMVACPAVECPQTMGGFCSSQGQCQDAFPD